MAPTGPSSLTSQRLTKLTLLPSRRAPVFPRPGRRRVSGPASHAPPPSPPPPAIPPHTTPHTHARPPGAPQAARPGSCQAGSRDRGHVARRGPIAAPLAPGGSPPGRRSAPLPRQPRRGLVKVRPELAKRGLNRPSGSVEVVEVRRGEAAPPVLRRLGRQPSQTVRFLSD